MDQEPRPPGDGAGPFRLFEGGHASAPADHREGSLVLISEGRRRLSPQRAPHVVRRVAARLHRHRRDARERLAVLLERGEIADDEDFAPARKRELRRHLHAARPVERSAQRFRQGRRGDAGGPEDRARRDPLGSYRDACPSDARHLGTRPDVHSQPAK